MKEKVQTLQDFGEVLHEVRSEMCYATDLRSSFPPLAARSFSSDEI